MLHTVNLAVEYKKNPLGMDEVRPRFFYNVEGDSLFQSARQIKVYEDSGSLVWDTGWEEDSRTIQLEYEGLPLKPFTRYNWQVRVKDEHGKASAWSKAFFETGFLGTPWKGVWLIAGIDKTIAAQFPCPCFRKDFTPKAKIKSARLYAAALGLYSAFLNGEEVGDTCFAPGWTDYHKRVQYQAYDVTKMIRSGKNNALSFLFGDGWYRGHISRFWNYGERAYPLEDMIRAELHITYQDGTKEIIGSDKTFYSVKMQGHGSSYIRFSDIYMGESFVADRDGYRWMLPETDIGSLYGAYAEESHTADGIRIDWNSGADVRHIQVLEPVTITKRKNGNYIVDFGQNMTGREKITLRNPEAGTNITIRHGEMLRADGSLYTDNLRYAAAATTIHFRAAKDLEVYEPRFTFYGFRYLEITGWPGKLTKKDISAGVIHSDLPRTGFFRCSEPLVNQLFSNIIWGQKSNFLDIPTDCPQRDERLGWTGDTQVFSGVATYNMYSPEFYTKWLEDLNLGQLPGGEYPDFCPRQYLARPEKGNSGWADAGVVCPWVMFEKYADTRIIRKYFSNICRWLDCQTKKSGGSFLVGTEGTGDWLNMNAPTPSGLISTAYYAGMSRIAAKMAERIGREQDARERLRYHKAAADAFAEKYFDKNGNLTVRTQTAALLALAFGCVPEKYIRKTVDFLVHDIRVTRKLHLSTGFLGTPLLLKILSQYGETDLAYDLLLQTDCPSWLYPVTQGATTMWERWNSWTKEDGFGDVEMNSFNHYAYGAVGEWFYENICGIRSISDGEDTAGFRKFRLAPCPGNRLTEAECIYKSISGEIRSAWKRTEKQFIWEFTVPCNTFPEDCLRSAVFRKRQGSRNRKTAPFWHYPAPTGLHANGEKKAALPKILRLIFGSTAAKKHGPVKKVRFFSEKTLKKRKKLLF